MPQLPIADKTTQDQIKTVVDSMNSKVGVNTDAKGTTTLFARLRQIYEDIGAYVDELEARTGTSADSAGTTTVFARLRQTYEYLTTHWTTARAGKIDKLDLIGVANPTANTTDIMGYLRKISDSITNDIIQPTKPRTAELQATSTTANTWYTVANITGKGKLNKLIVYNANRVAQTTRVRVTIDGVLTTFDMGSQARLDYEGYNAGYAIDVFFKNSAIVEVMTTSVQTTGASLDYALV